MTDSRLDPVWSMLERFLADEVPLAAFEQWVYGSRELESAVGRHNHLALLSFGFHQPHASIELAKVVKQIYDERRPHRLARDRARRLATGLIDGTLDLRAAVRALSRLHNEGNRWVPIAFVGLDSELDDVPTPEQQRYWAPEALESKLNDLRPLVEHCRQDAIRAAKELLEVT